MDSFQQNTYLATAHAAGILHSDIKPDNILVGRNGYAKLADFGLAKLEERSTPEAITKTLGSATRNHRRDHRLHVH